MSEALNTFYNQTQSNDRQVNELIGMARGITADNLVNQAEA